MPLYPFRRAPRPDEAAESEARLQKMAKGLDLSGDPGRPMRLGILFLVLGLGGFLVWAALAPLDEGVPAPGAIVIESQRKPVQHLTGGIVRTVHVAEAQRVAAGEVLLELDDTRLRAEFEKTKADYLGALARIARLQAEQVGVAAVTFPPELLGRVSTDVQAQRNIRAQEQFFASRRAALQAELRSIDEAIASQTAQRAGLQARLTGQRAQQRLLAEQLVGSRDLASEGYLPRNRLLEEERQAADFTAQIANLEAAIAANDRDVSELRLRRQARDADFRQKVDAELAELDRDLPAFAERLSAFETELERTRIVAPVAGAVVGLQVQSVGAIIAPGSKIMDIVPSDERLVLDVQIPPQLVDRVQPGLVADIMFHAFQDAPQFYVEGRLVSVSADRLVDPVTHQPYFLGRIEVLQESMKHLQGREVVPGMGADAVIKTGERSLLDYLLRPLIRRISTSMTEH